MKNILDKIANTKYDEVNDYMKNLVSQIKKNYGDVDPTWESSLQMLSDWYVVYIQARQTILESEDPSLQHKAFIRMNTSSNMIQSISKSFALNPMSQTKMSTMRQGKTPVDEMALLDAIAN